MFDVNLQFKCNLVSDGICITDKKCTNNLFMRLCQGSAPPPAKLFWNLRFENIKCKSVWYFNKKYCVTNKTKILIYPVNQVLSRFKNAIDGKCFAITKLRPFVILFYDCLCDFNDRNDFDCLFWTSLSYMENITFTNANGLIETTHITIQNRNQTLYWTIEICKD